MSHQQMTFLRGTPINLVQEFFTIDAISGVSTPADPTGVTFEVLAPDNVSTTYTFGTDPNVTNPSVGVYVCALVPQLPPGEYKWLAAGTGAVVASFEGSFTVLESAVLEPVDSTVAFPGPCSSWINGEDVAQYDPNLGVGSSTYLLDDVAYMASYMLYALSGRQYPGVCERTVRPCTNTCACFGMSPSLGLGPWAWLYMSYPIGGWWWSNECGDTCGCGSESYVRLAGYPVRDILEVKLGGVALANDGTEYRLDQRRNLIRLPDLTDPDAPLDRFWPVCQDLSLPDTEPGTYSVKYTWGADVPALGRYAAAQLAAELWKAAPGNSGECRLPTRVSKVVRQGITYEKIVPTAELLRSGSSGLQIVDSFIAIENPNGNRMRSAVFSPDLQEFARQVGQ